MLSFIKRRPTITAGGETFSPEPMNLEQTLKLVILLAPYFPLIEDARAQFEVALSSNGSRPQLITAFLKTLAAQIDPLDITMAFAIMLDRPPEWFRGVKPVELVEALPVLDEVNKFDELFMAIGGLFARMDNGR